MVPGFLFLNLHLGVYSRTVALQQRNMSFQSTCIKQISLQVRLGQVHLPILLTVAESVFHFGVYSSRFFAPIAFDSEDEIHFVGSLSAFPAVAGFIPNQFNGVSYGLVDLLYLQMLFFQSRMLFNLLLLDGSKCLVNCIRIPYCSNHDITLK